LLLNLQDVDLCSVGIARLVENARLAPKPNQSNPVDPVF